MALRRSSELARDYRVIGVDLPGCGRSDKPAGARYGGARAGARFLVELVDALGIRGCRVVGNSMGGYLCMRAALADGGAFSRLVNIHSPGVPDWRYRALGRALSTPGVDAALAWWVRRAPQRWAHRNVHYFDETLKSIEEAAEYGDPLGVGRRRARVHRLPQGRVRAARHGRVRAPSSRRAAPRKQPFAVPLLLLYSRQDPLVPPSVGERLHALVPDAPLVWLEATSHFAHVDTPEAVVRRAARDSCRRATHRVAKHPRRDDFRDASSVTAVSRAATASRSPTAGSRAAAPSAASSSATLLRAIERAEPTARAHAHAHRRSVRPGVPGAADVEVAHAPPRQQPDRTSPRRCRNRAPCWPAATAVLSPPRLGTRAPTRRRFSPAPPPPAPTVARRRGCSPSAAARPRVRAALRVPLGGHSAFARTASRSSTASSASACVAALDAPALVGAPRRVVADAVRARRRAAAGRDHQLHRARSSSIRRSLPPDEPLRYRARMAALHEGFFVELRELWHGDRVVALNQQTFAILR